VLKICSSDLCSPLLVLCSYLLPRTLQAYITIDYCVHIGHVPLYHVYTTFSGNECGVTGYNVFPSPFGWSIVFIASHHTSLYTSSYPYTLTITPVTSSKMSTQQQPAQLKSLTTADVAKVSLERDLLAPHIHEQHNKEGDLWVIIDSIVYDLSKFAALHPGGSSILLDEESGKLLGH